MDRLDVFNKSYKMDTDVSPFVEFISLSNLTLLLPPNASLHHDTLSHYYTLLSTLAATHFFAIADK